MTDPLLLSHPLPIARTFYPLGHALELATDSEAIADTAAQLWGRYPQLVRTPPVRLSVSVSAYDAAVPLSPCVARGREHLVSLVSSPENFAVADLAQGFAFATLSSDVARNPEWSGYYFLEPLAYMLLSRHVTILHAACVSLAGRAILIAGDSGAGKTCLSYACARRGWAFLSGDACQIPRSSGRVVLGRPFSIRFRESARGLFPELGRHPASSLNGKVDIAPPIDDLGIALELQSAAAGVVFLKRIADFAGTELHPLPPADALNRLETTIFVGGEQLREEQRADLEAFTQQLPAWEMTYSHLAEAERALRQLVS